MSADFSRAAAALGAGLVEHADRDGLRGVRRAVFMDRGGHAPGEVCPSARGDQPQVTTRWRGIVTPRDHPRGDQPQGEVGCPEFDEDVDDLSMCVCGVPALGHR